MPVDSIQDLHCKWLCSQYFLPAEGWWATPASLWLCSPGPVPAGVNTQWNAIHLILARLRQPGPLFPMFHLDGDYISEAGGFLWQGQTLNKVSGKLSSSFTSPSLPTSSFILFLLHPCLGFSFFADPQHIHLPHPLCVWYGNLEKA